MSAISTAIRGAAALIHNELAAAERLLQIGSPHVLDGIRGILKNIGDHASNIHAAAHDAEGKAQSGVTTLEADVETAAHVFAGLEPLLQRIIAPMRKEIQDLITVLGPLLSAVQATADQHNADAKTISDLQAQLAAGQALQPDEVQALADAASRITATTARLAPAAAAVQSASTAASDAASAPVAQDAAPPSSTPPPEANPAPQTT